MSSPSWEYGSDFECRVFDAAPNDPPPWRGAPIWMTARCAWQALIEVQGWQKIWIPSYFCHDVSQAAKRAGAEVVIYYDDPLQEQVRFPAVADEPGEAAVVVNTFGRRRPAQRPFEARHCELVEDHTQDPLSQWARTSRADWCLASLRKTLPVPVGGVLWSPQSKPAPTPPPAGSESRHIALERLLGMTLKRRYLEGKPVPKGAFRHRLLETESQLAEIPPSAAPDWAATLIERVPMKTWRDRRRQNLEYLIEALRNRARFRLLSSVEAGSTALGALVLFESPGLASTVEAELIRRNIYPARLWRLDGTEFAIPRQSVNLAARLLFLPCDARYQRADLARVARALSQAVETAS